MFAPDPPPILLIDSRKGIPATPTPPLLTINSSPFSPTAPPFAVGNNLLSFPPPENGIPLFPTKPSTIFIDFLLEDPPFTWRLIFCKIPPILWVGSFTGEFFDFWLEPDTFIPRLVFCKTPPILWVGSFPLDESADFGLSDFSLISDKFPPILKLGTFFSDALLASCVALSKSDLPTSFRSSPELFASGGFNVLAISPVPRVATPNPNIANLGFFFKNFLIFGIWNARAINPFVTALSIPRTKEPKLVPNSTNAPTNKGQWSTKNLIKDLNFFLFSGSSIHLKNAPTAFPNKVKAINLKILSKIPWTGVSIFDIIPPIFLILPSRPSSLCCLLPDSPLLLDISKFLDVDVTKFKIEL